MAAFRRSSPFGVGSLDHTYAWRESFFAARALLFYGRCAFPACRREIIPTPYRWRVSGFGVSNLPAPRSRRDRAASHRCAPRERHFRRSRNLDIDSIASRSHRLAPRSLRRAPRERPSFGSKNIASKPPSLRSHRLAPTSRHCAPIARPFAPKSAPPPPIRAEYAPSRIDLAPLRTDLALLRTELAQLRADLVPLRTDTHRENYLPAPRAQSPQRR